jgi:hypothetical protein
VNDGNKQIKEMMQKEEKKLNLSQLKRASRLRSASPAIAACLSPTTTTCKGGENGKANTITATNFAFL